jgi:type II secretory pathway pseudopilin PulG
LVELLVVIAIISLLATMLLPALTNTKANARQVACLGNLRQLEVAFQMYAADNGGYLVQNVPIAEGAGVNSITLGTNSWVYGNMKNPSDATNAMLLKIGKLYSYAPQSVTFHCPADSTVGQGQARVRSYSMNSWIGSAEMEAEEEQTPFRIFLKDRDLAAGMPSAIWVHVDEHVETLDDGWFPVTMDNSMPFAKLLATRHQNAYNLDFADGHAETYRLRSAVTHIPETQSEAFLQPSLPEFSPDNTDWIKLKGVTTSP